MRNVTIYFRNSGVLYTAISEKETLKSLGDRVVHGGYLICNDHRHQEERSVLVNLKEIVSIVFESAAEDENKVFESEEQDGEKEDS